MNTFLEIDHKFALDQGYVTVEEDYTGGSSVKDARFFSLTPHPDPAKRERGFEKVTYFLNRKKLSQDIGKGREFVYILSNPALPGLLKIGYTSKKPNIRIKEVSSSTGVPVPFKLEFVYRTVNGQALEKAVHKYLEGYRVNNKKEFFQVSINTARQVITEISKTL